MAHEELMHPRQTEELHGKIVRRAYAGHIERDLIPPRWEVDNAIQWVIESVREEDGATPNIDRADVWSEVEVRAIDVLGFDYDEVVEVAP
jgi:hypothetical protein